MIRREAYNIEVYNNDTYEGCEFTVLSNELPVDLTGAAIRMQVRKTRDALPVIDLALTTGLTIIDAVAGKFAIDAQVFAVTPDKYKYDIQITFSDDTVKTYITGSFNVLGDITHG